VWGALTILKFRSARSLDYWGSDRRTTPRGSQLTGKISWLQLDLGNDDHDHFVDPEEQLRIAISRQLQELTVVVEVSNDWAVRPAGRYSHSVLGRTEMGPTL
jgi:hypothetical protein